MKRILALFFVLAMVFSCVVCVTAAEDADATAGAPSSFTLEDGASVRLVEGDSGLRFETRIKTAELDALKAEGNVTVGTLIIPTDKLTGELTLDTPDVMNLVGNGTVDGDETVFYAAIVDIQPQNYARKFSARSYVKVGDGEPMYTAYSDASNSRSIFQVAVEAWEGSYRSNTVVKSYLDKVVRLTGNLNQVEIDGYASPFTVTYADGKLSFAGSSVKEDLATVIIDGRIFTGGWEVEGDKLTAPYALYMYNDFNSGESTTVTNESATINHNIGTPALNFTVPSAAADASSVTEIVYGGQSGELSAILKSGGAIWFTGTGATVFASADTISISMSLKLADGATSLPSAVFRLRGPKVTGTDGKSIASNKNIVKLFSMEGTQVKFPTGTVIATVTADEFVDVTVTVDLKSKIAYGYCNGELVAMQSSTSSFLAIPSKYPYKSGTTKHSLLEWAQKTGSGDYFLEGNFVPLSTSEGVCLDGLAVSIFRSN